MWHLDKLGRGRWADQNGNWSFDLHGGATGLSIGNRVNLRPVDNDTLPVAEEQYIRGDRWHVNFPQGDESFALRLGLEVVDSRPGCCVIECCIAIQTDRLDLHPRLDIVVDLADGSSINTLDPVAGEEGSAAISLVTSPATPPVAVVLGEHDAPFTTDHSNNARLRLRLFGDFLEKGVIRKARPWLVFGDDSAQSLREVHRRLGESPLPLKS